MYLNNPVIAHLAISSGISGTLRGVDQRAARISLWARRVLQAAVMTVGRRLRRRRTAVELSRLNDRMLRDIGLERADIPALFHESAGSGRLPIVAREALGCGSAACWPPS